MVTATTAKAAVGSENQVNGCSARPTRIRTQFTTPKEESKIQMNTTTATTSGMAQGRASSRRAMVRPLKALLSSSAVASPITTATVVTMTSSLNVTQHDHQNSAEVNSRS